MLRNGKSRRSKQRPTLSVDRILRWADTHHKRTGDWPQLYSGDISGAPGDETWRRVDRALRFGLRGLPAGSSLARLLAEQRQVRNRSGLPRLTADQVLAWADAYHTRTGEWPNYRSGPIPEAPGEKWRGVDECLRQGARGLRGGQSLAKLIARKRGVRNRASLQILTIKKVLAWADAHRKRTGRWPTSGSGPIADAPGETWKGVNLALRWGYRGLTYGNSLAELLARERSVRNRVSLPRLTNSQVAAWARTHFQRSGTWPSGNSGPIPESHGETWHAVDLALRHGYRGFPGGSSLSHLLHEGSK
jgi:hypothetical protein